MSVPKQYTVSHVGNTLDEESMRFVKEWHYSNSCRSLMQTNVFKLLDIENNLCGVCIYGKLVSMTAGIKYGEGSIELRKLCLIDDTPKNTESFFIGKTLKYMKRNTNYNKVISYADPNVGHEGTIYKATNFKYIGHGDYMGKVLLFNDRVYHFRQVYQKKKGIYTKNALMLQLAMRSGDALSLPQLPKHVYLYKLR